MIKITCLFFLLNSQNLFANKILFLGDSLTEGYGISKENAYPALVMNLLKNKDQKDLEIINGGVSGSTTNDGLARLKWYLKKKPSILFLALGANDGLRGLKISQTQKNLQLIIDHAINNQMKVLMAGMLMPPNYGKLYTDKFKLMYQNLKKKNKLQSMPFLLEGIAGVTKLNQADGIHPNEEGHKKLAKKVYIFLKGKI